MPVQKSLETDWKQMYSSFEACLSNILSDMQGSLRIKASRVILEKLWRQLSRFLDNIHNFLSNRKTSQTDSTRFNKNYLKNLQHYIIWVYISF